MYEPDPPFPAQQQTMAGNITANLAANVSVGSIASCHRRGPCPLRPVCDDHHAAAQHVAMGQKQKSHAVSAHALMSAGDADPK